MKHPLSAEAIHRLVHLHHIMGRDDAFKSYFGFSDFSERTDIAYQTIGYIISMTTVLFFTEEPNTLKKLSIELPSKNALLNLPTILVPKTVAHPISK